MHEKSEIITSVCTLLETGEIQNAVSLLKHHAAISSISKLSKAKVKHSATADIGNTVPFIVTKRKYTAVQSTRLFIKDGFVDRYDGERLIFPGALRLLSDIFPNEFPYHPNWKAGACHQWYWELFPTVDHIVPVTLAGIDDAENWVTTSMLNNLTKSNSTLEILGWDVVPRGDFDKWDGLIHWFVTYLDHNIVMVRKNYINNWYRAAISALKTV